MKQIRIIFTSDIHGYFYPTDYLDRERKPKGLLHIAQAFRKDGNTLILDGGDTLQGSPFSYYSQMEGRPDIVAELSELLAGYRFLPLKRNTVFYRVHDDEQLVEILRIYDNRMDIIAHLLNDR